MSEETQIRPIPRELTSPPIPSEPASGAAPAPTVEQVARTTAYQIVPEQSSDFEPHWVAFRNGIAERFAQALREYAAAKEAEIARLRKQVDRPLGESTSANPQPVITQDDGGESRRLEEFNRVAEALQRDEEMDAIRQQLAETQLERDRSENIFRAATAQNLELRDALNEAERERDELESLINPIRDIRASDDSLADSIKRILRERDELKAAVEKLTGDLEDEHKCCVGLARDVKTEEQLHRSLRYRICGALCPEAEMISNDGIVEKAYELRKQLDQAKQTAAQAVARAERVEKAAKRAKELLLDVMAKGALSCEESTNRSKLNVHQHSAGCKFEAVVDEINVALSSPSFGASETKEDGT